MQTLLRTSVTVGLLFVLSAAISAVFGPDEFILDESQSIELPWVSKVRHSLLNMWTVKRELAITNDQWRMFETLEQSLFKENRALIHQFNFQDLPRLSPAERDAHVVRLRWKLLELLVIHDQRCRNCLKPQQLDRLTQLTLQRDLIAGLNQSEIAARLGLCEQQKEDLRNLAMISARSDLPIGTVQRSYDDCLDILTEDQRVLLPKLMGVKFKFPRPRPSTRPDDPRLDDPNSGERVAAMVVSDSAPHEQVPQTAAVAPDSTGTE